MGPHPGVDIFPDLSPTAKPYCGVKCSQGLHFPATLGGGGTPIHYLYGCVPPNRVVILKLLIYNRVSISEAFSRTGIKNCGSRLYLLLKIVADYKEAFI